MKILTIVLDHDSCMLFDLKLLDILNNVCVYHHMIL